MYLKSYILRRKDMLQIITRTVKKISGAVAKNNGWKKRKLVIILRDTEITLIYQERRIKSVFSSLYAKERNKEKSSVTEDVKNVLFFLVDSPFRGGGAG